MTFKDFIWLFFCRYIKKRCICFFPGNSTIVGDRSPTPLSVKSMKPKRGSVLWYVYRGVLTDLNNPHVSKEKKDKDKGPAVQQKVMAPGNAQRPVQLV